MKRRMVLASKSPRRRELLEMLGAQFEVITSDCDENITGLAPRDLVRELALRKAEAVYERLNDPDAVVIGSDTIVTPDGVKALGKPRDRGDAVRTLTELSGKWHSVCTGIAVIGRAADNTSKKIAETVETKVKFLDLTKEECERYADTGEPLDKAGSYGIQDRGGALVEKIDGDYYSVVGLPVSRLRVILRDEFGINLL
ncbi:MAG: Maf family protein [Eubacteriales bacterium]